MFGWISHTFIFLEQCPLHTNYSSMAALRDNNRQYVPASAHATMENFTTEFGGSRVIQNPLGT